MTGVLAKAAKITDDWLDRAAQKRPGGQKYLRRCAQQSRRTIRAIRHCLGTKSSGNAPLYSSGQAREKNAVFMPETAFVNSLWRGYKNFWFYHFSRIIASETVESSFPNLLATPVFFKSIHHQINILTDGLILYSIKNYSFLCTIFCSWTTCLFPNCLT